MAEQKISYDRRIENTITDALHGTRDYTLKVAKATPWKNESIYSSKHDPSYEQCKTKDDIQNTYEAWVTQKARDQFIIDKKLYTETIEETPDTGESFRTMVSSATVTRTPSVSNAQVDKMIEEERVKNPRSFYQMSLTEDNAYWYIYKGSGGSSFVNSIVTEKRYAANLKAQLAAVNTVKQVTKQTETAYWKAQKDISTTWHNLEHSVSATWGDKDHVGIGDIFATKNWPAVRTYATTKVKEANAKVFGSSIDIWNDPKNANNEIITAYNKAGISGDVVWDVIKGKYNQDNNCRKDIEKLIELLKDWQENRAEYEKDEKKWKAKKKAIEDRREKINTKYNMSLPDIDFTDVTSYIADLEKVIGSDEKYRYKQKVKQIAEGIVEQKLNESINTRLDELLGDKLKSIGINFSFKDRQTIEDLRQIIRGTKVVKFNEEKFLKGLRKQLEKRIDKLIQEKVNSVIEEQAKRLTTKVDQVFNKVVAKVEDTLTNNSVYRAVDKWDTKLTDWTTNQDTVKLAIATKLDQAIAAPVNGVAKILNAPDKLLKKWGLGGLGLGNMFTEFTKVYTKGWASKINTIIQPYFKKALAITTKIKTAVKNLIKRINQIRERAKALVNKWKQTLLDQVKKYEKQLINSIIKSVKINFSSLIPGSFKI